MFLVQKCYTSHILSNDELPQDKSIPLYFGFMEF